MYQRVEGEATRVVLALISVNKPSPPQVFGFDRISAVNFLDTETGACYKTGHYAKRQVVRRAPPSSREGSRPMTV